VIDFLGPIQGVPFGQGETVLSRSNRWSQVLG
jgi:hypothetical protein